VPGYAYNTESGLEPDTTVEAGGTYTNFGLADSATRFQISFANVGTGVRLFLPVYVELVGGTPNPASNLSGFTKGFLQLVGGSGGVTFTGLGPALSGSPLAPPFDAVNEVTLTGGSGSAIYEVVNADPSAIESASILVGVGFVSNTSTNTPPAKEVFTASAGFWPQSTNPLASSGDPIPRFCPSVFNPNVFTINICQCQLLFPFVTQAPGFDTGIAIANTSMDTYNGLTPQTGIVTLWFYGQEEGGAAVPTSLASMATTSPVPAGQVLTYTTFSGGGAFGTGLAANPGFTGYVIAVANFQYCHGFAFISDLGAQKLAEGYLAIQLDTPDLPRTGNFGEQKGH
jgi:hypothetical protein